MTINLKNMSICLLIPMILLIAPKSEAKVKNCMDLNGQRTGPVVIDKVDVGYVEGLDRDSVNKVYIYADSGNAIAVYFKNEAGKAVKLPLNHNYNLNAPMGGAIYSSIMTAFTLGLKVILYDHHGRGDTCDDFDEIQVFK